MRLFFMHIGRGKSGLCNCLNYNAFAGAKHKKFMAGVLISLQRSIADRNINF
jgi:hypothetical protein